MAIAVKQLEEHKYFLHNNKIGYLQYNNIDTNISYGYLTIFAYLKEYENG